MSKAAAIQPKPLFRIVREPLLDDLPLRPEPLNE
jgi:hypothetical protein